GASCDWERTRFTMEESLSQSVINVFVDLYEKGKIYRGVRMVNWDPVALTALSDEEVIYKEEHSKLFYLRYKVEDSDQYIIVATTRPETILGDSGLCVHPEDPRYAHLRGKRVIVPIVGRSIPIIFDEYVDMTFGTGALKVTPAHDVNDYMLGEKYGLESIDIFNDNGTINDKVGLYVGIDRFEVRRQIEKDLAEAGLLEKVEAYENKVGYSERSHAVIEPKLSMQWFLSMKELSQPALESVMNDTVRFVPAKFKNTYRHWMENIKDWCISRQLWWGQQIPAYYLPQGGYVVAATPEAALEKAREKTGNNALEMSDLRQDPDVLDTWFSSWLWPISVFDGIRNPDNEDIKYYYPTCDLVTAPDIMFFWVARMITAGYEYIGEKPFSNVYFTGTVRDKLRRKMSKSLGNSPDPLDLIATYGADGVRVGMLLCSAAGNDLMYDDSLVEQGRNFGNKIWNAYRLVKMWQEDSTIAQPENNRIAIEWFDSMLSRTIEQIDEMFAQYRISEALMLTYKLFWDEFSGWYLELIKPAYQQPIDSATLNATKDFFERLLKMLHPFMPFITEEIWHDIQPREEGESIMISLLPVAGKVNETLLEEFEQVKETITAIRNIRKEKNIPNRDAISLSVNYNGEEFTAYDSILVKMSNIDTITAVDSKLDNAVCFMVKNREYFIPMDDKIDTAAEIEKITAELEYAQGFLASVMKKLNNERFVSSAPANVVENERAKKADAEAKIRSCEERLAQLKK
ncbi:MAG: valine--tRNA ligase, partial [Rikenellaceae bacterium]|nr:valine--tRNA ligase [Rikenellaceae bacterium]